MPYKIFLEANDIGSTSYNHLYLVLRNDDYPGADYLNSPDPKVIRGSSAVDLPLLGINGPMPVLAGTPINKSLARVARIKQSEEL
jgi:hypothetical protein